MDKSTLTYPPNFTRSEMLMSATATRLGIINEPNSDEIEKNILATANYLQLLRDRLKIHFDKEFPIRVFSCYRCPKLNEAVGGSQTSAHMKGLAADIIAMGMTPMTLAKFIRDNCEFDQLILEFNQWVHVGIPTRNQNRGQVLTATKIKMGGLLKTKYLNGLV